MSLKHFLGSLAMAQLAVENLLWDRTVLHSCTVASSAKLVFHDLCLNTDGVCCRSVGTIVVPSDAQDLLQAALVVAVQFFSDGISRLPMPHIHRGVYYS